MALRLLSALIVSLFLGYNAASQSIATFEVDLTALEPGFDVPVQVDLETITFLADSALALVKVRGGIRDAVPHQIEGGRRRALHWIVPGDRERGIHVFELIQQPSEAAFPSLRTTRENGAMVVWDEAASLLAYQFETVHPPDSIDGVYARSGFIHPLWTPGGKVLTQMQPPDHYHHYGIWNPWTNVEFEGRIVDFWNLHKREGTVRFAGLLTRADGSIFSDLRVLHEHIAFDDDGGETVVLNEVQSIRVYRPMSDDHYVLDVVSEISLARDSPVRIRAYRYGGFTWRTTETWTKHNSDVFTSAGHARNDADSTRARWFVVQGEIDGAHAGAIVMSSPTNYNHPEPIRIWPDHMHERGELMANFSPIKNMDWQLNPGQIYVLKYRLVVFDGEVDARGSDAAWQAYARPPRVRVTTGS